MASISFHSVTKRFDNSAPPALSEVDFEIDDGEFIVLVGPSGCGKTTLLRIVAGLEVATKGKVVIGGSDISNVSAGDRNMAMVFQNYALFPHLTVAENIGFGLKIRGMNKTQRREKVEEVAASLGLSPYLDRRPGELSGGQRQRVAMGRAIVRQPAAFLMDEPLSNLDAKLRVEMRAEISRMQRRLSATTIYVTHDQVEAMTMGDRVVVLDKGIVQQIASPAELYQHPANSFVARFIGAPTMNTLVANVANSRLAIGHAEVAVPERFGVAEGPVLVGARPEHVHVFESGRGNDDAQGHLRGKVVLAEHLGKEVQLHMTVENMNGSPPGKESAKVEVSEVFVAAVDPSGAPIEGAEVEIVLNLDQIHMFDLDSGLTLMSQ